MRAAVCMGRRVPSLRSGPGTTRFSFGILIALLSSVTPPRSLLRTAEQSQQLLQALIRRFPGGVENEIRLGIERLAARQNGDEVVHCTIVVRHRAQIALFDDAPHVFLGIRLEPYGAARGRQELVGAGLGDEAAARRDDEARMALQDRFQRGALVAAKNLLAEEFEQLAQADPAVPLDLAVELDERYVEPRGK